MITLLRTNFVQPQKVDQFIERKMLQYLYQSISIDLSCNISKEKGKNDTASGGKKSMGRGAIKGLGFKMPKNATLNFYDKWRVQVKNEFLY